MLSTLAHYPEEELRVPAVVVVVVTFAQRKRRKGAGVVKACALFNFVRALQRNGNAARRDIWRARWVAMAGGGSRVCGDGRHAS